MQAIPSQQSDNITQAAPIKVYGFSEHMLYPLEEDRTSLSNDKFIIDGVIVDTNFNNGFLKVRLDSGEEIDIQFYPLDAPSAVQSELRLAIKVGNKIKSICARAGARTLDLVTAEITAEAISN